jgi:proline iminopeptidase
MFLSKGQHAMSYLDELGGHYVPIPDTRLYVVERGQGYPILIFHGGPGLDHHAFADYLDPLADQFRLIFVDERSQGRSDMASPETWTIKQMARDIGDLARALDLTRYATLGHSYGAFVVLQHAVDYPDEAAQTIISNGIPSTRFLAQIDANLAAFEPMELRARVATSWMRERSVQTQGELAEIVHDQWPFHFADPLDPRIVEIERRSAGMIFAPHVLHYFAANDYGMIEVEDQLGLVTHPTLVLAGRKDRTCSVEAAETMAHKLPFSELKIFDHSGHMPFVEEQDDYLTTVSDFLNRHL